jgi:hypothetical protein
LVGLIPVSSTSGKLVKENEILYYSQNLAPIQKMSSRHVKSDVSTESPASSFTKKEPAALEAEVNTTNPGQAFENVGLEKFYKPIPTYEGYHRFDPEFQWEPEEERIVVRRVRLKFPFS